MTLFYDRYSAALYGVIFRIVKAEDETEDVLQEAMVKIWNAFASYDPSKGRLFTWVLNICRNLSIDKIRSRQHRVGSKTMGLDDSLTAQRQAAPVLAEDRFLRQALLQPRRLPAAKTLRTASRGTSGLMDFFVRQRAN